jgi:hypothetical protein
MLFTLNPYNNPGPAFTTVALFVFALTTVALTTAGFKIDRTSLVVGIPHHLLPHSTHPHFHRAERQEGQRFLQGNQKNLPALFTGDGAGSLPPASPAAGSGICPSPGPRWPRLRIPYAVVSVENAHVSAHCVPW